MNWFQITYLVGCGVFYISTVAMYLDDEIEVTALKLLVGMFLIGPCAAIFWPILAFILAINAADNTVLWKRRR